MTNTSLVNEPGDPPVARDYLDNASGMPLLPVAREAMLAAFEHGYADPRRLHHEGRWARLIVDNARAVFAECLSARPDEVVFTTNGTEAVHRGLLGLVKNRARSVVVSSVEHSSVFAARRWLGGPGYDWPVNGLGALDLSYAQAALAGTGPGEPPAVIAVQTANHEVGTRQPLAEVREVAPRVPLFVDACASMGVEPLDQPWDVAAGSAHKWGGPSGVGVLLIRKGVSWRNPYPEDERADFREIGFANLPALLGAAAALQYWHQERQAFDYRARRWLDRMRQTIVRTVPDVDVLGDPHNRLPHVLTFSCLYVHGESLVAELDQLGLGVASGSACTASVLAPSHVLGAMGALTHGNVRVSLGWQTTEAEVDHFLQVLPGKVAELRSRLQ